MILLPPWSGTSIVKLPTTLYPSYFVNPFLETVIGTRKLPPPSGTMAPARESSFTEIVGVPRPEPRSEIEK